MLDDEDFGMSPPPARADTEVQVPMIIPRHGPRRYRQGSITVTHTSTSPYIGSQQQLRARSEEALHIRSHSDTRIEKVVYSPFALYRCGNTYHYKSVGYSTGGDIILVKDEISSSSDAEKTRARSLSPVPGGIGSGVSATSNTVVVVSEAMNLESGKKYPGVKVVRGHRSRNRAKNSYLLDRVQEMHGLKKAATLSTQIYDYDEEDENDEHRIPSAYHEDDGSVSKKWQQFVNITMDQEKELLAKLSPNPRGQSNAAASETPANRFSKLTAEHIALMKSTMKNDILWGALQSIENDIHSWLEQFNAAAPVDVSIVPARLYLDEPCHRKILHAVSSYYNVKSWSDNIEGRRVSFVDVLGNNTSPCAPAMKLSEFLQSSGSPLQQHVSHGENPKSNKKQRGRNRTPRQPL